ncbi:spondin domain-containing protein [Shewanella woodyi]|uniref:spondin domain-containing protein n=1 Tax=Shewanella woodyi TaxID=60961 RepID=UPI003748F7C0
MNTFKTLPRNKLLLVAAISSSLFLSACSDSDNTPEVTPPTPPAPVVNQVYSVTVTNLTANQPMSPITLIAHGDISAWQVGSPASLALETIAESGDGSLFSSMDDVDSVTVGAGILPPGMSESIELSLTPDDVDSLSILTMLVNTNDAFAGLNDFSLSELAVDQTIRFRSIAYDAGTESNSEAKGTLPGPADGGEGFNAMRDDVDRVHAHPGVISQDDGLTDSVLSASHRFDNPVLSIMINRTQ